MEDGDMKWFKREKQRYAGVGGHGIYEQKNVRSKGGDPYIFLPSLSRDDDMTMVTSSRSVRQTALVTDLPSLRTVIGCGAIRLLPAFYCKCSKSRTARSS